MTKKMQKNRGEMGVGTLIIFIAVILVAAVAAAVLISVSGSLQQRSLATGQQAEEGVSTGAEAVSLMAINGSSDHKIEAFELLLRLQAGSDPMNLNSTVIVVDTADTSQNIDYAGVAGGAYASTKYGVEYVKSGPDYKSGYLSRGDIIKVRFNTTSGVGENKKVRLRVIPRVGQASVVEFSTPDVMKDYRVNVWP
jgi:flagellin FlaB